MTPGKTYDAYTETLAALGTWEPNNVFGRDVAERVRDTASSNMVAAQGLQILQQVWATLPPAIKTQMVGALEDLGQTIADTAGASADAIPVIGAIVKAAVSNAMRIVDASKILKDHKKAKSNFAHGKAQMYTIYDAFDMGETYGGYQGSYQGGLYVRADVFEFAQFIKVRWGGDYDRKPGFGTPGGWRDSIFLGSESPAGSGCKKDMRRKGSESLGPFSPACGRTLGLSASLWPWWSAAYEPGPITRYVTDPAATFQEPPSPDTNGALAGLQVALLTDPARNLRASLKDVVTKTNRFLAFWRGHSGAVYPMGNDHIVQPSTMARRSIDAAKDPDHSLSESAGAYWYYDAAGFIVAYDGQLGNTNLEDWGIALPEGKPTNLGCTLEQHNAVLSSRAAFAQRRLSTLRTPALVKAIVLDNGMPALDSGAHRSIEYSEGSAATMLPYPGGAAKIRPGVMSKPAPLPPKKQLLPGDLPSLPKPGAVPKWVLIAGGVVAAGAAAGGLYALQRPKK